MMNHPGNAPLVLAVVAALAACTPSGESTEDRVTSETAAQVADEAPAPAASNADAAATTLRLEGLGSLVIGEPIPAGSSWAVRGAQISESCETASSPEFPGAYAMLIDDEVRRISISDDSEVSLLEGVGPGSTETDVLAAFPGFVATPHKYVEAPSKYLTQPGDDPRLRFEIDADGKVSLVHVGLMPQLAWVEGCA